MKTASSLLACVAICTTVTNLYAQDNRIFRTTPETVAIWEFNDVPGATGDALPDGAVVPDLSGNGHDVIVKNNGSGAVVNGLNPDRELFCGDDDPDLTIRRAGGNGGAHAATDGDGSAFEFAEDEDFSVELFVVRDENPGGQNWGILAGTWHSRTLLDDSGNPTEDGAWYGYGLIRHNEGGGWVFNMSPINPDGTFDPSFNEVKTSPNFEIPAGEHYLAISVDREAGLCTVYLDGVEVSTGGVPPGRAFYTPPDYDPAQFAVLTGVDDVSRGAYRTAPVGYAISAARVQTRTISAIEAEENVFLLEDCIPVPFGEDRINAVIAASSVDALVDQCLTISGANSTPGEDEEITAYEWKVGDGAFEAGEAIRELSFDEPTDEAGVEITLRVTDTAGDTAERSLAIVARHPTPTAVIRATREGSALGGSPIWLRDGDTLTLDGADSWTPIPSTAVLCPSADAVSLEAPAITEYRWDLDSDGNVDETAETVDLSVTGPSEFTITLTVVNETGAQGSATLDVAVVEVPDDVAPGPPGRIFLEADETVAIWEFNDFEGEVGDALANDTLTADETDHQFDGTVEGNDLEEVVIGEGDPNFGETNTSIHRSIQGDGRVSVNDDEDMFEMDENQSFSVELYVHREELTGSEQWGVLAGTWHSRNLADDALDPVADGAWYGYGFIREGGGGWLFNLSPISPDGTFNPSFNEIKTPTVDIPPGYHYLVATVSRGIFGATAKIYLDGDFRGQVTLPTGMAFITPPEHDHARMMFLVGEDDASRSVYRGCPSGYSIDAARVSRYDLSAEEIEENHRLIRAGIAVPPNPSVDPVEICDNGSDDDGDDDIDCDDADCDDDPVACPPAGGFVRGDSNSSGSIDLTDGVVTLNFLFTGGSAPPCLDAADTDDNGALVISDAVITFSYLFTGGSAPVSPSPSATSYVPEDCAPDPNDDGLDCAVTADPCG